MDQKTNENFNPRERKKSQFSAFPLPITVSYGFHILWKNRQNFYNVKYNVIRTLGNTCAEYVMRIHSIMKEKKYQEQWEVAIFLALFFEIIGNINIKEEGQRERWLTSQTR